MPKLDVISRDGKSLRSLELNEAVFGIKPNEQAMFDMIMLQRASLRQGTHATKNRSAVRGGGRKPWRQKGTGRARQGSIRSPQWRGGGVVFGPTPRNYGFKLNRKVRRLALQSALSKKVAEESVLVLENLDFEEVKTKAFAAMLENLGIERKVLFVYSKEEEIDNAYFSMRNIPSVSLLPVDALNVYDLVYADHVVFTEKAAIEAGEVWA